MPNSSGSLAEIRVAPPLLTTVTALTSARNPYVAQDPVPVKMQLTMILWNALYTIRILEFFDILGPEVEDVDLALQILRAGTGGGDEVGVAAPGGGLGLGWNLGGFSDTAG
ncbi:MAG: hypothetical protein M1836_006940 [Candelina mexicana]|nr:MAG: hypothetical protein M1836_006940 [Candelina mexicana]